VIVRSSAPLAPDEAARRVATAADPIWLSSPGGGGAAHTDVSVSFDVVAAGPHNVVRGESIVDVERAWIEARHAWGAVGLPAPPEVPIGVGWLSYDLARRWVPLASWTRNDHDWADIEFRFFDAVWVRAVGAPGAHIFARDQKSADRLAAMLDRASPLLAPPALGTLTAEQSRGWYAGAIARIHEYLRAGDAYQVNLAHRLTATIGGGDPVWMAATLRGRAPAPHAIWMGGRSTPSKIIDRILIGNSPERFLRVDSNGVVETRPIKGTRSRGMGAASDAAVREALAGAAKDRAEHVMIVDLERNDLGRVCETGSVVVDGLLRVVALPTVFHLVSTVRGHLRSDVGLDELLRATFPGGSVTGAPKRRAMEIIEELEPVRRGIYTGATGWLGAAGDLDLAIAIRTATVADGRVSLSVGGGIVIDSDAADEWEETEVKARAFLGLCG
jgi:para-aminobenzoate synthetase component 1